MTKQPPPFVNKPANTEPSVIINHLSPIPYHPWLHRFAFLTALVTFALIVLGGTVTSEGVGLSVPDWPTTFGHHMFAVPLKKWVGVGGAYLEHSHRLLGSLVGMLAIMLGIWLWLRQHARPWLQWAGIGFLALVIVQGIMGGLRVTQLSTTLAVIHGVLAQLLFCLIVLIWAATGRFWIDHVASRPNLRSLRTPLTQGTHPARRAAIGVLAVMFIQLLLGSAMRHTDSGKAIPDFPTSFGRIVPPITQKAIDQAAFEIATDDFDQPILEVTVAQVWLHFAHRVWALVVVLAAGWLVFRLGSVVQSEAKLLVPVITLVGLLLVQLALGALVIWSGRYPEIATAHQAVGAALLAAATLLAIRIQLIGDVTGTVTQAPPEIANVGPGLDLEGAGS